MAAKKVTSHKKTALRQDDVTEKATLTEREEDCIVVKGARENNLKNITVRIPRNRFVVVTGVSGSGKSSLAFDTLFAEGQRRYVESLSSYARQFMGRKKKPNVDYILGVSPAVAIEQKVNTSNPRSTVGTGTEIYEYLKLLYARIGRTFSPVSGEEVKRHSVSDVVDFVASLPEGGKVMILAPLQVTEEHDLRSQLQLLLQEGFVRVSLDGTIVRIEELLAAEEIMLSQSTPMLLVDRLTVSHDDEQLARIAESVQTAFFEGRGSCIIEELISAEVQAINNNVETSAPRRHSFSNRFEADGIVFEKPNPNFFSFNNPYGACPTCQGYGSVIGIDENLVIPNKTLSLYEDCVACWKGEKLSEYKKDFLRLAAHYDFPVHTPYCDLTQKQKDFLWHGAGDNSIDGFFRWVEGQQYKIQYRVLLARYRGKTVCPDCHGSRLRPDANYVKIADKSITDLSRMSIDSLAAWLQALPAQLQPHENEISSRIMTELTNRVGYLQEVGLGYLTLSRMSNTLSGGESQRINLATSLGSSLVGSMYILDEPSIGLHSRDTAQLISVLQQLRDLGNTVVVVEHDEDLMRAADYLIDIGPGAGNSGGEVVFAGTPQEMLQTPKEQHSLTTQYLLGERSIAVPKARRPWRDRIVLRNVYLHNLKHVDVTIPLQVFTVVTGVSGSGKTSLVKGVLYDVLHRRYEDNPDYVGNCGALEGDWKRLAGVELVDQNPIGRSVRSTPATSMKAYDEIRQLYAIQPLSKVRGYKAGWFSFNSAGGGRCEACEGEGVITIGMQFMADVQLVCEECQGTRFKEETLEVLYRGKHISDVLNMTIDEAIKFFQPVPDGDEAQNRVLQRIVNRLQPLQDVGVGYLMMGQSTSTLSGGEAQRVKLASFLIKGTLEEPRLFIFDEPSTGLHFHDIQKLLRAFETLIANGHSVVVIEHHHDIIKVADWVIDMGPEGGDGGGEVVFAGTPEELLKCPNSYTAKFLKEKLS